VWAVDNDSASVLERTPDRWSVLQSARELCGVEVGHRDAVRLIKADATELPFPSGAFDAIFCLDSLPFTAERKRRDVIREVRRVVRPGGVAVFTLPVEIGPALLLREILRQVSFRKRDDYDMKELVQAIVGGRAPRALEGGNLKGYDYRPDHSLLASYFKTEQRYLPWRWNRWFAPTMLFRCTPT
jgi:ubiquinone/menaquinone biosynthesis C-methylase UbiE